MCVCVHGGGNSQAATGPCKVPAVRRKGLGPLPLAEFVRSSRFSVFAEGDKDECAQGPFSVSSACAVLPPAKLSPPSFRPVPVACAFDGEGKEKEKSSLGSSSSRVGVVKGEHGNTCCSNAPSAEARRCMAGRSCCDERRQNPAINIMMANVPAAAVMNVEEPEFVDMDLTWDTACQRHVVDEKDVPNHVVVPNAMSQAGGSFSAAQNSTMPCKGEVKIVIVDDNGQDVGVSALNVTNVSRPLWSIGTILDNLQEDDCSAVFKRATAEIRNPEGQVLATAARLPGGLWVGRVRVRNPRHPSFKMPGFQRP